MARLRLFSAKACPFAHRTRLVLAEKQLEYELVEIDLQNKPSWFSDVSLYGKVPALEHGELHLIESAIINEYLEESFPNPALLPREPPQRARARIWIEFANSRFAPAFTALLRGQSTAEQSSARLALREALKLLEHEAFGKSSKPGPYFLGAEFSLVDATFYPWFERWDALDYYRSLNLGEFARVQHWAQAVRARPLIEANAASTNFYIERFARYASPPPASVAAAS